MTQIEYGGEHHTGRPSRPLGQAMWRGFLGRCPHCGEGKLFRSFATIFNLGHPLLLARLRPVAALRRPEAARPRPLWND